MGRADRLVLEEGGSGGDVGGFDDEKSGDLPTMTSVAMIAAASGSLTRTGGAHVSPPQSTKNSSVGSCDQCVLIRYSTHARPAPARPGDLGSAAAGALLRPGGSGFTPSCPPS